MNTLLKLIALLPLLLLCSCSEEVITVDLNKADPHIVIEGNVIEGTGPHTVVISKTIDFYKPSDFTMISDATVTISDDAGNTAALNEYAPGIYATEDIAGVPGTTYTLDVEAEGESYRAVSTMFAPSSIDSLSFEIEEEADEADEDNRYTVHCYFTDKENVEEFYRFKLYINDEQHEYYLYHDRLTDGNEIHYELDFGEETLYESDLIHVEMQSLDRTVFEFYKTLGNAVMGGGNIFGGTPANPETNISNGTLGVFSAYTSCRDSLFAVSK